MACAIQEPLPTYPCNLQDEQNIPFELETMPCVHIDMQADDFDALGAQTRFGGETQDQLSNAIGKQC